MAQRRWFREIGILFLFALIFVVLTYPLIDHFNSGIAGRYHGDGHLFIWNAWQFKQKITSGDFSGLTNSIMYPEQTPLILHTYTPLNSFLVFLLDRVTGNIVLSFNIIYLLSSVASAYFAYRFFYLISEHRLASIVGGQLFAFQSLWSIYALFGTQNLLTLWFLPASLFFYEVSLRRKKWFYASLSGVTLAGALINDFYPFIFSLTALLVYAFFRYFFHQRELRTAVMTVCYVLGGLIVAGSWKILDIIRHWSYVSAVPLPSVTDVDVYHADPINLIRPAPYHPFWGTWSTWFEHGSITKGNAFIGFTMVAIVLAVVVLSLIQKRKQRSATLLVPLLCAAVVTMLLSFGPWLHVAGKATGVLMPHYFIQEVVSSFNNIRSPARWLFVADFFIAGLLVYAMRYIFSFLKKKWQVILFVALTLGVAIDVAYLPRDIIPIYGTETAALTRVKDSPAPGTVLFIPFNLGSGYFNFGEDTHAAMSRQVVHGRAIVGGHLSRLPEEYRKFENQPVLHYLFTYKQQPPSEQDMDSASVSKFFARHQVRFIAIEKKYLDAERAQVERLSNYIINTLGMDRFFEDEYFTIYSKQDLVTPSAPSLFDRSGQAGS